MISKLERVQKEGSQVIYDLDSERNERRRLQQQVELLRRESESLAVRNTSFTRPCNS